MLGITVCDKRVCVFNVVDFAELAISKHGVGYQRPLHNDLLAFYRDVSVGERTECVDASLLQYGYGLLFFVAHFQHKPLRRVVLPLRVTII